MLSEKSNLCIISEIKKNKKELILEKNSRNYGIDFLRIFSMINIINLHINLHSRQLYLDFPSPKYKTIWSLEVFAFPAVNCFGLISGMVGYKKYKFSNLIYLWLTVFFYSISISFYLFFVEAEMNKRQFVLSLFPILIKRHWYFNAYFSMYFLIPFINYGINSLNEAFHKNFIIFFILFYSIYNLIAKIEDLDSDINYLNDGYSSMWLLLLYIIGAYFGKYIIIDKNNFRFILFFLNLLMFFVSFFISSEFHFKLTKSKSKKNNLFISYLSPTTIIQAFSLVMILSKLKIKNKILIKIISFLAPLNFSAYLIHGRLFKIKIKIIKILFNWILTFKTKLLFFKIYAVGIIIYIICIFIDYLRLLIFKLLKFRELSLLIEEKFISKLNIIKLKI